MPIKFRKNIRLKEYDYNTNGYYFVTIVTHNRLPLLKSYKDAIEISMKNLPTFINGLNIDYFKIMDNHIHIIFIFKNCARPLGRVVSAMKYGITKIVTNGSLSGEYNSPATNDITAGLPSSLKTVNCNSPATHKANCNLSVTEKKKCSSGGITIPPNRASRQATIWQWNYYEHIIRNEKSLQKIREYIDNNPLVEIINWEDLDK